jgi:hypothetical protein
LGTSSGLPFSVRVSPAHTCSCTTQAR